MATCSKKKIELLISGWVRKQIEEKFNKMIVPNGIKYMIVLYVVFLEIDSLILKDTEKNKLYDLLSKKWNTSFIECKLLYRGSRDGYNSKTFYNKCSVENTLCIIETDQSPKNNVFGGFTTKSWKRSGYMHIKDENAFLYLLRSSADYPAEVFDIKPDKVDKAFVYFPGYILFFGSIGIPGASIWIQNNCGYDTGAYNGESYQLPDEYGKAYFLGNPHGHTPYPDTRFIPKEVEVFQVLSQQ